MHTIAIVLFGALAGLAVAGAIIACIGLRRAPEGLEDESGFHEIEPRLQPVSNERSVSGLVRTAR